MKESWTAPDTIYFYKVDRPHGYLSNFSLHPIALDGYCWPTVEHYYQAQKFTGTEFSWLDTKIRTAATPEAAAAIGRCADYCPSADWPDRKLRVMERAVLTKFNGHPELRQLLLATGSAPIVEDSPVDYFWGCGVDRSGLNHLGKILMGVRTAYSYKKQLDTSEISPETPESILDPDIGLAVIAAKFINSRSLWFRTHNRDIWNAIEIFIGHFFHLLSRNFFDFRH
jgi:N-glycosidase YbiA